MLDRIRKMGFWVSDFCFCWFEQGKMNKNAIFVEIRGALGMSQYPHFSPTHARGSQWGCSKHGTRLIFWMFHATRLTPLRPSTNNTVI